MRFDIRATDPAGPVTLLTLRAAREFSFRAGQYIVVNHPEGGVIPMSLASAPDRLPFVTLHYRSTPGVEEASLFDDLLRRAEPLDVDGPFGDVWLDASFTGNVLIIAAGTGASQATSLLEAIRHNPLATATLFWSVTQPQDLYQEPVFAALAREPWFDYRGFVDDRRGRNQLLPFLETTELDGLDCEKQNPIVLCGPPPFVYAACDVLASRGLGGDLRSDVFAYAPRGRQE